MRPLVPKIMHVCGREHFTNYLYSRITVLASKIFYTAAIVKNVIFVISCKKVHILKEIELLSQILLIHDEKSSIILVAK
jgi:hypothetical protein